MKKILTEVVLELQSLDFGRKRGVKDIILTVLIDDEKTVCELLIKPNGKVVLNTDSMADFVNMAQALCFPTINEEEIVNEEK